MEGRGVEINFAEAKKWLAKAEENGCNEDDLDAMIRTSSVGVRAEEGDADAQCELGGCYLNGRGVEDDEKKAIEWFEKAAEQGHPGAQHFLSQL